MAGIWPTEYEIELYLSYPDLRDSLTVPSEIYPCPHSDHPNPHLHSLSPAHQASKLQSQSQSQSSQPQPQQSQLSHAATTSPNPNSTAPSQRSRTTPWNIDLYFSSLDVRDEVSRQSLNAAELQEVGFGFVPPEVFAVDERQQQQKGARARL